MVVCTEKVVWWQKIFVVVVVLEGEMCVVHGRGSCCSNVACFNVKVGVEGFSLGALLWRQIASY